jgi:uncharacterized protein
MAAPPFVVDLAEVLRRPGARRELHLDGPLPGVELTVARIPGDATVTFDGTVEAQGQTVIAQGRARAPWVGECRRCLESAAGEMTLDVREVFEPHPVEGETFPVVDERIDLGAVLRELLALALPLAPLCREDCPGPDPEAHPVHAGDEAADGRGPGADDGPGAAVDGDPTDGGRLADPRWGALDQLRFDA